MKPLDHEGGGRPGLALFGWAILLWGIVALLVVASGARLAGRLPHVLPVVGLPIDAEGRLEQAIAAKHSQLASCAPAAASTAAPPPTVPSPTPAPTPVPSVPTSPAPSPTAPSPTAPSQDLHALPAAEIAHRLERSAVLVLSVEGSGSGFFITPNLIVTNRHVVESEKNAPVLITSKTLGRVMIGRVVAKTTGKLETGGMDFAVIQVDSPPTAEPLVFATGIGKLQKVVVAGYPGLVIDNDVGFRRLLSGDPSSAPDLSLTEGSVTSTQASAFGVTQIVHSAVVLTGNSGGPLVDACNRLVGINTFIAIDESQSGHVNYALSANDLAKFLTSRSIIITSDPRPCN